MLNRIDEIENQDKIHNNNSNITSTYFSFPNYDANAIKTWVYRINIIDRFPTNKTKRDYQFNIIKEALLTNTMVCLPTGLGKTFIAAVIMFNFMRWFPNYKIVFCAPNRPLVQQQVKACQLTMGISCDIIAHLHGEVKQGDRAGLWLSKKIFFCTPQTFYNDLKANLIHPRMIILTIFDEAHRATGNYDYCNITKTIIRENPHFRVNK